VVEDSHLAGYWHLLDNNKVQCDLCPHFCQLKEGQRGLCYIRGAKDQQMHLYSYGKSSGFCVDPIEKKPLNHFLPGTAVLSFGTAGCNLTCKFCQNWDISKSRKMHTLASTASPETLANVCLQSQCRSIAYTYNDPIIFIEYAIDVAQACAAQGIKSVAVSAGYINEAPRAEFFKHMHAANIDLKGFNNQFYKKICGGQLAPVKETLEYIANETQVWLEVTNLIIPGENDSQLELEQLCQWHAETLGAYVPLHFTAFHPDFKMLKNHRTPLNTLLRARQVAINAGIKHVYCGNVQHSVSGSSYCQNCEKQMIERSHYQLGAWHLNERGQCHFCGHKMAGVFEAKPGNWGAKRQVVKIVN